MTIPTYDQFIFPLLRLLAKNQRGIRSRDAYQALADEFGLTDGEREEMLPSGMQRVHHNRIAWAHDRLKRAGYSESVTRGTWKIREDGLQAFKANPKGFPDAALRAVALVANDDEPSNTPGASGPSAATTDPALTPPDERIDAAVAELHASITDDLLERISRSPPEFFERLVIQVLVAMGYGQAALASHVGRSGDGGIDGVITLDRLGLEKVYVQAKRWQNTVGRPDIQSFFGALAGRRASKGVFITTSTYSSEARQYAGSVSDSLVLIDGQQLARLMIEYCVGVSVYRSVRIVRVDTDFFEES